MKLSTTLAVIAGSMAPAACIGADAAHPYSNIDPRVDAGNSTGDDQVDVLNQAELDVLATSSRHFRTAPLPAPPPMVAAAPVLGNAPPPLTYYPPPQYAPPPPYYYPPPPWGYGPPPAYYPPPAYGPPPGYGPPPW